MSRLSIRLQIFLLAAVLVGSLLAVSGLGWVTQRQLGAVIQSGNNTSEESAALNALMEEIDESVSNLLLFGVAPDGNWDTFAEGYAASLTNLTAAEALFTKPSEKHTFARSQLEGVRIALEQIPQYFEEAQSEALFGQLDTIRRDILPKLDTAEQHVGDLMDWINDAAATARAEAETTLESAELRILLANSFAAAVGILLAYFFGRQLSQPIERARERIGRLVGNDYDSPIADRDRGDEVGAIARALEDLRRKLVDAERAEERTRAENGRRIDLFQALGVSMSQLRGGKLGQRIEAEDWEDLGDSYVKLCRDFNDLAQALETLVASLRDSTQTVRSNATELSGMSEEMSRRAEVQAATLEESAAALDALSSGVQSAADKARDADEKVVEGRRRAEEGGEVMARALQAMSSIAKSSEQISQIITVIDDIAFQTNLLALNAGVEAARAGESGKGFSVVASEVRGLAQRASASAGEIKELVMNSVDQVEDGERLVQETSQTLSHIVDSVSEVSGLVSSIARMAREQAGGVQEINVGIAELDKVTQHNAAMVNQTSASSQQLTVEATRLSDLLAQFTGGTEVSASTSVPPGVPELFGMDFTLETPLETRVGTGARRPAIKSEAVSSDDTADAGAGTSGAKGGASRGRDRADDGTSAEQKERLLHGSWEGENVDPRPVEVQEEKVAVNAPAAARSPAPKKVASAASGPVSWDEF
ncbi:chemotaxis protein [Sagittula sp. P11]|uniref:methyl-accepting chemotaxis protein n=1 Tax=Sagittula sp. P11 TaxID=2009329 RepID=UPI000C2D1034|nr:HAMP domain-containing methyl-accepting chemotaxis protein [Sagittula sp. P11]AUC53839.1 chemotaxis protein [Sagittula sp. P11]